MKTENQALTYQVINDNSDGLHLYVFDADDNCIYAHGGYEYCVGQLRGDLERLATGSDPREWDGCEEDPQASYDSWTDEDRRNGGWEVVADQGGPIPIVQMGAAAIAEFYPGYNISLQDTSTLIPGGHPWGSIFWSSEEVATPEEAIRAYIKDVCGASLEDYAKDSAGRSVESDDPVEEILIQKGFHQWTFCIYDDGSWRIVA